MPDVVGPLLVSQAFLEPFESLFRGLFDKGHVLCQMLLSVDLAFFTPFLLVEPKLRDDRSIFLVQFFPNFNAT